MRGYWSSQDHWWPTSYPECFHSVIAWRCPLPKAGAVLCLPVFYTQFYTLWKAYPRVVQSPPPVTRGPVNVYRMNECMTAWLCYPQSVLHARCLHCLSLICLPYLWHVSDLFESRQSWSSELCRTNHCTSSSNWKSEPRRSVWLISCRGLLTADSRGGCYPSWLGNSRLSETAHTIGFVHPRETSCALDVQWFNWSVFLPPKHSLSTGEIRNMETAMSCDSYFYDLRNFPRDTFMSFFQQPSQTWVSPELFSEASQIGFNISDLT